MMEQRGLTLVELIATLTIATVIISIVAPAWIRFHARSEAISSINWMIGAVNFSRHAAIKHRITTTLCPSADDGSQCAGEWHQGVFIFADHNMDARLNGEDFVIQRIHADHVSGTFKWRSFRNRNYLQFTQLGYTNYQNGNFIYCPPHQDLNFARQIVINVQGRTRIVNTRNAEGLIIDRQGRPLRC